MILFVAVVIARKEHIDAQRPISAKAGELVDELTHALRKHFRSDFLSKVLLELSAVISRAIDRVTTVRNVASKDLAC